MTVPWEAMDPDHPDHADWVRTAGRCFADHDHEKWLDDQEQLVYYELAEHLDGYGDDDADS